MGRRPALRLLLDTHALLWWATDDMGLSRRARAVIRRSDAEVHVSAASGWEIATKARLGRLEWPPGAGTVSDYVLAQGFRALPISMRHAEHAGWLRAVHRDPFDRMLMAQALLDDLWLVSNEAVFDEVGVRRFW